MTHPENDGADTTSIESDKLDTSNDAITHELEKNDDKTSVAPKKNKMKKIIFGVAVVLILFGFANWHVVYNAPNSESALRTKLVQMLPFPVAYVNEDWVLLRDFEANIASAKFFLSQQGAGLNLGQLPSMDQLRQNELDRLVNFHLKKQIATERGVTLSSDDVNAYFDNEILPQAPGGIAEVEETLRKLYNWSVDDFKKNILEEVVLDDQLQKTIQNDETTANAVRDRAQKLRDEIVNSDKPFSDFASENSDDTASAVDGGMLGYFGRGEMVPEFENAAFVLEVGAVSEIVKTQYGYHIIKVTNKDTEGDRVEARHILLSFPTPNSLVEEKRNVSTIKTFLPRYSTIEEIATPVIEDTLPPSDVDTAPETTTNENINTEN